jgi:hypothetical protein
MVQWYKPGVMALLCAALGTAVAAPVETGTETRTIDPRVVRIKLDGLVDLKLKQGAVASLVITGDKTLLATTTTAQKGDTLTIANEGKGFTMNRRKHGVRAELTLPQLRELASDSLSSVEVSGFIGEALDLTLDGAGAMKVVCDYRHVTAVLGGVGSMHITSERADTVNLNLRGAGVMTLKGATKSLTANLGGLGSLHAEHFHADTVNLDLSGLGNAAVSARQNANLTLSGLGSVAVHGRPVNRSVSVSGLGKVTWK